MFIDDATLIRAPSLLLFQFLHPLLQGLHHAPQDHRQLLVIQGQQLLLPAHGLAQGLAQLPGGLHVLGDEAELVLGSADAVVVLRFHFIEEPLDVLLRHAPDVRLEPPVRGVQVAVTEDHLAVAASPRVGFHGQISDAAGGVERDELVQGVELHAAVGQRHQLASAPRGRVVLRGEEEAGHSRGRLVDDRQLAEAAGVPEPRDRGKLGVHLQPRGAAGEEQVWQAGLRGDGPVDPQRVVDQDALRTPFDREPGRGRVAAHQRRFEPEVADGLQVGGDAAVGVEDARGGRAAHGELGDVRRGGVQRACRCHRHVPVHADVCVKLASSAPSSLRTVTRAFWIWRSPAELCSWGVSTKVVAVRLLTVRSAVGATPPLFSSAVTRPSMAPTSVSRVLTRPSMDVTVLPSELKAATRG